MAAVGLVAAGCAPVAPHPPAPTRSAPPGPPTSAPVGPPDWADLAGRIGGSLARPGDPRYETVKLTENPRWDAAMPLAVLTASGATDVSAALAFAQKYALPIAVRSGGHSYPGYSAGGAAGTGVAPSLVIDLRGIDTITFGPGNRVNIGAGASLAQVYDAVGRRGRALAGGSCATVGIAGLALGGGVGVLVREYGLTCDSLVGVKIVTADGVLHNASADTDSDLFWACRGGGGGHLGVVTSLSFETKSAPTVTMFALSWPFSSAAKVVRAWQAWAPHADSRLWSTLKLLNGPKYGTQPGLFVSGTWLGDPSALPAQFAPFFAAAGRPATNGSATHSYHDAMMSYADCATIPLARCNTGKGGSLERESFGATSHIAYEPLDGAAIQTLISKVVAAGKVPGIREGGISMDALGGAVGKLAPDATAFPHRKALASVQYTATFPDGKDPAPLDAYVRGFRAAMAPSWGDGAYVNYSDPTLADPAASYFGDNASRLRGIRAQYDPTGVFTQPQGY
jgi:FAD/FMN-containing dehydrogenase